MMDAQSEARARKFAGMRAELEGLSGTFDDLRLRTASVVKAAAKRRDDLLAEHIRKEHLS